ncbi:MAG: DUF1566 domain-containing protein, partial [Deltaproteobacteria bacterium]|nr:DUF1566 domain-containing protein [Deltaproteobacteria bacterium]
WRLPTVKELSTLVDAGIAHPGPTIDIDYFPHCKGSWYWSSSSESDPGLAGNAWYVRFSNGYLSHAEKVGYKYVRAVRAGHPGYFEHSFVVGDGTVTDTGTGLMWQQATMEGTFTWEGALSACENLVLGGHRDWRLPNRNELLSLVDYSAYNPSIDAGVFSDTVSDRYWTSSPYATDSGEAWAIRFDSGALTTLKVFKAFGVGNLYRVRAVRTAQGGPAKALPSVIMLLLD